jgi:hypothetical protein
MMAPVLIEKEFVLSEPEQLFVDYLMSNDCPYYYQDTDYGNEYMWGHVLMRRDKDSLPINGSINSQLYEHAEHLFLKFCSDNDITPKHILRAAINATGGSSKPHGVVHVDHTDFEHYNFIMYLNDVGGNTCLFDENKNIVYEVVPAKNKVVVFKGHPHAQAFCKPGDYRFVLVFTFTI